MYKCRKAVRTHEVLQCVRMQVDNIDGRQAARTSVGQQWVPSRFCNAYEHRSTMLPADEQHVLI